MKDKVSIIITTYNRPEYLRECINSCMEDTYENKEIIIVDDFSSTQYVYSEILDSIKLIRLKKHIGISAARNAGLEVATGDYIRFIDDDDKIIPGSIKRQVNYLNCVPNCPEVDMVYCNSHRFKDDFNFRIVGACTGPINIPWGTVMIKKSAIGDIRFREVEFGEDILFWKELKEAGCKFSYYDIYVYMYRMHPGRQTLTRDYGPWKKKK